MTDSIGTVCCSEDCKDTEYSCACKNCEKKVED